MTRIETAGDWTEKPRAGLLPLLPEQRMAHFHRELFPGSPAYNCAMRLRLEGQLDIDALVGAVHALVDRNRTFRGVHPRDRRRSGPRHQDAWPKGGIHPIST